MSYSEKLSKKIKIEDESLKKNGYEAKITKESDVEIDE